MDLKPKTAIETLILVNERRIEAVQKALQSEPNLIISSELQEDICALIVTIEEYNKFLKDLYADFPDNADHIN